MHRMPDSSGNNSGKSSDYCELEKLAAEIAKTQMIIRQLIVKSNILAIDSVVDSHNVNEFNDEFSEISNQLWEMAEKCSQTSLHLGILVRKMKFKKKSKILTN